MNDDVLCYLQTNPTPVIGGTMTEERLSKAKVAWYTTEAGDDVETDTIRALAEGGKLDGKVAVAGAGRRPAEPRHRRSSRSSRSFMSTSSTPP